MLPQREDCEHAPVCKFDDQLCPGECGHFADKNETIDAASELNGVLSAFLDGLKLAIRDQNDRIGIDHANDGIKYEINPAIVRSVLMSFETMLERVISR